MGASLSTFVTSPRARTRMLGFLRVNYRDWTQVSGTPGAQLTGDGRAIFTCDGTAIGTEYLGGLYGWERCYVTALCRWIALKIGRTRTRFSKEVVGPEPFLKPAPYIIYDSFEYWPILVRTPKAALKLPPKRRWCAVDRFGCYLGAETHESLVSAAFDFFVTDEDRYHAYAKAVNALGPVPADREKHMKWLERRNTIKARHAKPIIAKTLPVLRGELERLDRLWKRS